MIRIRRRRFCGVTVQSLYTVHDDTVGDEEAIPEFSIRSQRLWQLPLGLGESIFDEWEKLWQYVVDCSFGLNVLQSVSL